MKIFNPFVNPITNMFSGVISKQTNNMIDYVKNAIKSRCLSSTLLILFLGEVYYDRNRNLIINVCIYINRFNLCGWY